MKVGKAKLVMSVLLVVAVAVPVVTYVYSQTQAYSKQIPTVLVIRLAMSAQFGVYWDYECTDPVTTIDFGEIPQPRGYLYLNTPTIYIRNEQPDETIWVYWNSTLGDVTTEIYDYWISNGTRIEPDDIYYTSYNVNIQANAAIGTYSWTLGIWAEY